MAWGFTPAGMAYQNSRQSALANTPGGHEAPQGFGRIDDAVAGVPGALSGAPALFRLGAIHHHDGTWRPAEPFATALAGGDQGPKTLRRMQTPQQVPRREGSMAGNNRSNHETAP